MNLTDILNTAIRAAPHQSTGPWLFGIGTLDARSCIDSAKVKCGSRRSRQVTYSPLQLSISHKPQELLNKNSQMIMSSDGLVILFLYEAVALPSSFFCRCELSLVPANTGPNKNEGHYAMRSRNLP